MTNNRAGFVVFAITLTLGIAACGSKETHEARGGPGHPGFFGHGPEGRGGEMSENKKRRMAQMKKELGITDAQEKKLKELRDARSAKMAALSENIWAKREAVMKELGRPDYNVEKARKAHAEMKVLSDQLEDNLFDGLLEARKILTDKQIKKIGEMGPLHSGGPGAPDALLGMGGGPGPGPGPGEPPFNDDMRRAGGSHAGKGAPPPPDAD